MSEFVNNIVQDKIDTRIFNELKEASIPFKYLVGALPSPWEYLTQDLFAMYYKVNPRLTEEDKLSFAGLANRPYVEKVLESNETQITRAYTMLDELASALATMKAGEVLRNEIMDRESLKKIQRKIQQVMQEGNPDSQQMQIQDEMNAAAKDIRRAIRKALEAGQKESEEVQVILNSWGINPGELKTMPLGDRLNLVERLRTPKMKRISEMVGRMRNIARERQKQKLSKQRDEIHSITIGKDLAYTLPAELAVLRHPLRKKDFLRRLMEGQVLEYELTAREKQGRGPMVVLLDCSGSMELAGRYDWALAVTAALVDTADRQKRRSTVIVFDTEIKKEIEFGKDTKKKLLDLLVTGPDYGGTNFEVPISRGMELIETSVYKKADIVMITDGVCKVSEEFKEKYLQVKKKKEFRLWTILINANSSQIQEISDKVWAIPNISDEAAGELFQEVY